MQHLPGNMRNLPIYFDVIFLKNFQREPCSFSNKIKKKKKKKDFRVAYPPYLCTCELNFSLHCSSFQKIQKIGQQATSIEQEKEIEVQNQRKCTTVSWHFKTFAWAKVLPGEMLTFPHLNRSVKQRNTTSQKFCYLDSDVKCQLIPK